MLMHDICPFRIGSRVKVHPRHQYALEWPGNYVIVMIEWDYQKYPYTGINIAISRDDEIKNRNGWTDGWSPDDLLPA